MSLIESISDNFNNIENIAEGIIRAEKTLNNKTYQVHFFDDSKSFLDDEFDIDSYQEKYILSDYYSREKSLQWNFYLHFLADSNDLFSDNGREISKRITENTRLTRKTVSTLDEIVNGMESIDFSEMDIVDAKTIWSDVLGEQYQEILDVNQARTVVIDNISNKSYNVRKAPRKKISQVPPYKRIKQITIGKKFRTHSSGQSYTLSDINLIEGVNAVGKTSLLESIELCVCGKTYRNEISNPDFNFYLEFTDGSNETVTKSDELTYINRAYSWYGQSLKSNEMPDLFSRYNFYNADAASNFSRAAKSQNLSDALSGIIFGADAWEIFKRIQSFQSEINKEITAKNKRYGDIKYNIRLKQLDIENRESVESKENSIETVNYSLTNLGFTPNIEKVGDINVFVDNLGKIENLCIRWKVIDQKIKINNYESIVEILPKLNESLEKLIILEEGIKSETRQLFKLDLKSKTTKSDILLSNKLVDYFSSGANKIFDIKKILASTEDEISRFSGVISRLSDFETLSIGQYKNQLLGETRSVLKDELSIHERDYSKLTNSINTLKSNMDRSFSIISEVVSLGREFIELEPESDYCPLCNTILTPGKLTDRIKDPVDNINKESAKLDSLLKKLADIKAQIDAKSSTLNQLSSLEVCTSLLFENPNVVHTDQAISASFEEKSKQEERILKLEDLNNRISNFEIKGFTNNELSQIVEDLNFDINSKTKEEAISLSDSFKKQLVEINNTSTKLTEKKDDLSKEKISILESLQIPPNSSTSYVKSVLSELEDLERDIQEHVQDTPVSSNDTPDSILLKLESAKSISISFLKKKSNNEIISQLRTAISKDNEELTAFTAQIERLNAALEKVNTLVVRHSLDYLVNTHLNENIKQIQSIFTKIHTPSEFDSIEIVEDKLILRRRGGEESCDSTMMSTGQRSALALSVFLSMNMSLKKGPPFIIFDDPITYIDDLNILSFLDYLQTMAIKSDKQIFFATASKKISTLMQKKMDFMGDGFKRIPLNR